MLPPMSIGSRWTVVRENLVFEFFLDNEVRMSFEIRSEAPPVGDGDLLAQGYLKWDGCLNIDLNPTDTMQHFCGQADALGALTTIVNVIYDNADRMPNWDGD